MSRFTQRGFSLVEALLALLVLTFGLLGIATLQLSGVSKNRLTFERSQAALLANEIVERIRANPTGAANGDYDLDVGGKAQTSLTCVGVSADCSPAELATADLAYWQGRVTELLGDTETEIQVTVVAGSASSVNLTISWHASELSVTAELA